MAAGGPARKPIGKAVIIAIAVIVASLIAFAVFAIQL
jgi:hypothetical protein